VVDDVRPRKVRSSSVGRRGGGLRKQGRQDAGRDNRRAAAPDAGAGSSVGRACGRTSPSMRPNIAPENTGLMAEMVVLPDDQGRPDDVYLR